MGARTRKRTPQLDEAKRKELISHLDQELFLKASGMDHLPAGMLGIYRQDTEDWEGDQVAYLYLVFDEFVDLDDLKTVPKVDFSTMRRYFDRTISGRLAIMKFISLHDFSSHFQLS